MTTGAGVAGAADPAATIADPAGAVVVDTDVFAHWRDIARRGNEAAAARDIDAQVLSFLVSSAWILGEGRQHDIVLSEAEIATQFHQQRMQAFPREDDYQRFLRYTGYTEADLKYRIDVQETSIRLRDLVLSPVTVTEHAVTAFLRKHPQREAERRDVVLVATRTRAAAHRALGALRAGRTFRAVAHRYSIDRSRRRGGVLAGRVFDNFGRRLAKRIFATAPGTVVGPVHAGKRWYLFRVLRIHPEHAMPSAKARRNARDAVLAQAQQQALEAFAKQFQATWRSRTTCAPAYTWITDACGNAGRR